MVFGGDWGVDWDVGRDCVWSEVDVGVVGE